jgi:hypothetical protein
MTARKQRSTKGPLPPPTMRMWMDSEEGRILHRSLRAKRMA